jgi:hypothetical protein
MNIKNEIEVLYYNLLRLEERLEDLPFNDPEVESILLDITSIKEEIENLLKKQ